MKIIPSIRPILKITGTALFLFLITFTACSRKTTAANSTPYLPTFLKGVKLGQNQANVLKLRPAAHVVNTLTATQWQQFTEDLEIENFTSAYYDFERTSQQRLVAVALLHKDESSAAATFKNFGGQISKMNTNERSRSEEDKDTIYATKKGRRVTFSLPAALQKNMPSLDQ
ncbi:MAG: hypothetical protein ACRBFS_23630 [Aureispira sp.]